MTLNLPSPMQSMLCQTVGGEVEEGATEVIEAAAEPEMAGNQNLKMENRIKPQLHQDGQHQDMLMGLQVQPVLTIIPTAAKLFIVPTP